MNSTCTLPRHTLPESWDGRPYRTAVSYPIVSGFRLTRLRLPPPHSRDEFRHGFAKFQAHGRLRLESAQGLWPHDFSDFWHEKLVSQQAGTREWAFAEIIAWVNSTDAPQLFWLMGGGGTGKSVLTAALLDRIFDQVVAWHFCRHDNPQQSAPASVLRSLAAMLLHRIPGYTEALGEVSVADMTDPKELFATLFEVPLNKVTQPEKPLLIILDALDELPKDGQKPLLNVIAAQLSKLPKWLRIFTTSRDGPQIRAALSKFEPQELRADEAKNRADVEVFLRTVARKHVTGEVKASDIEVDVKRRYGIDVSGKFGVLQGPMDASKAIYDAVREKLRTTDGFQGLLEVPDNRNEP